MTQLTPDQKTRFAPALQRTYQAIAADANCADVDEIVEITCDANHPELYGGMSRADYDALCAAYTDPDTQRWLREVLNY